MLIKYSRNVRLQQIFIVRQICEKYLGKGKDVYFVFLDLGKAYDRVVRCNVECFEIKWNWW